jgi:CheY-like chemotaxis protein
MIKKEKTPRLLVADDDHGVIAAYRLVLETNQIGKRPSAQTISSLEDELFSPSGSEQSAMRWRIDFVDQGYDAVAAVQNAIKEGNPFDAVFLDIRMPPGIDGFEAAKAIRKLDRRIQVIIVSGYSDYTEEELLEVAGPENRLTFMPKPVWPKQLLQIVSEICEKPQQRGSIAFSHTR